MYYHCVLVTAMFESITPALIPMHTCPQKNFKHFDAIQSMIKQELSQLQQYRDAKTKLSILGMSTRNLLDNISINLDCGDSIMCISNIRRAVHVPVHILAKPFNPSKMLHSQAISRHCHMIDLNIFTQPHFVIFLNLNGLACLLNFRFFLYLNALLDLGNLSFFIILPTLLSLISTPKSRKSQPFRTFCSRLLFA